MPHSIDREYAERAIPQYERAVELAGGEPVRIPLDQTSAEAMKLEVLKIMESCAGVLLPGSKADVDPVKFDAPRSPRTAADDPRRDAVDQLLLQDAYNRRKPVLGICYGLQSLNVFRSGSLIQHIPDFLPEDLRARVDHAAGKKLAIAHDVEIESNSNLAEILRRDPDSVDKDTTSTHGATDASSVQRSKASANSSPTPPAPSPPLPRVPEEKPDRPNPGTLLLPVNSSHHQSADAIGQGLRIAARCPTDGIIEALEGTARDHFVLAVQWHPERSVEEDESSRSIFRALIE